VTSVGAEFRSPARYDERLAIETAIEHVGGARVRFTYRVTSSDDGRELATGFTEHGAIGREGRPTRIPDDIRRRLGGVSGDEREEGRR
jgi:acyl-CoA thioester hydrolase